MRIQNNITAMNTHRMYTSNNTSVSKSAEKLSSGYRINRAGDDAAGLAISEKMRSQIRGLNMASKNSQDANSLIQTAEGALQEVHSMLQRMGELANQSATGTNQDFDRSQISAEFDQLKSEINDISEQTNFNNMKLLDGSLASGASKVKPQASSAMAVNNTLTAGNVDYTITKQTGLSSQEGTYEIKVNANNNKAIDVKFTDKASGNVTNTTINLADVTSGDFSKGGAFTVDLSAAGMGTFEMTAAGGGADPSAADLATALTSTSALVTQDETKATATGYTAATNTTVAWSGASGAKAGTYTIDAGTTTDTLDLKDAAGNVVATSAAVTDRAAGNSQVLTFDGYGSFTVTGTGAATKANIITGLATGSITVPDATSDVGGALKIQVGANEGEQLSISIEKMNVDGLGLTASKIDTQEKASSAITSVQTAINSVSAQRSTLGAMQNRLEHKISNLDNTSENLSASESRIRDVDMAKEMTAFTKSQILSQASTAMLAQANSLPQNVLSLLQ